MAKLSDFVTQPFDQGEQLKTQYKHNKDLWGGICFALMCEWFKLVNLGTAADKRMKKLEEVLTLCGSRQKIYTDYIDALNKAGGGGGGAVADTMSQHGNLYGVKFGFEGGTDAGAGAIANHLAMDKSKDKFFYLQIIFDEGAHAIGVTTKGPLTIYDPNFGEHVAPKGKRTSFFKALWSEYKKCGMPIEHAFLYEMSKKQTLFDFWEKKAKTG